MHETSQTSSEQTNGAAPDHPRSLVECCHGGEEHVLLPPETSCHVRRCPPPTETRVKLNQLSLNIEHKR